MLRLRHEHAGRDIDPRQEEWKEKIEKMLAGEHKDTSKDRAAFDKLRNDIKHRTQLHPGVVTLDGGVIDGNRRLAALRRLNKEHRDSFRVFDAVVLPKKTTSEDRWRIEAGLQLGVSERWDYSPINELLKVRDGVRLYEDMIRRGKLPKEPDPIQLVADAIYGRSVVQIREMVNRLDLIDEYLRFIKKPEAYDDIGAISERFLEATKVIQAAENDQRDPAFLAKLKAALFYLIEINQISNWDIRRIYDALGGDPRKRGRKPVANEAALNHLLNQFPEPRDLQEWLLSTRDGSGPASSDTKASRTKGAKSASPTVNPGKISAATQTFLSTMETQAKPVRTIVGGARGQIESLHEELGRRQVRDKLGGDDKAEIRDSVETMLKLLGECLVFLRKRK